MWRITLPSKATAPRSKAGYTLLEMLFVLALTAFLLVILSEFLLSGMKLWVKNDRAYRLQHQLKFVFQVINKELSAAYVNPYLPDKAMKGDDISLSFWKECADGLFKVKYRYEQTEKIVYRTAGLMGTSAPETVLFKDIINWKFEYYQSHTKNWLLEWDDSDKTLVPSLIRISITTKESDLGTFVIPIKAWHSEEED
jgi:prepilin-type N-terminal cleavage/methylation domain-containing protein